MSVNEVQDIKAQAMKLSNIMTFIGSIAEFEGDPSILESFMQWMDLFLVLRTSRVRR